MDHKDWFKELTAEAKAHEKYREKATKVEKRYRLESSEATKFNILWSNVEIQQAALYSQTPKPDAQRRNKQDGSDVARLAAEVLEKALEYSVDQYDLDDVIGPAVNNYLVSAMGTARVNYTPTFGPGPEQRIPLDRFEDGDKVEFRRGDELIEDAQEDDEGAFMTETPDVILDQDIDSSVVPWKRFRWSPAKDWDTVWWVGEDHFLTDDLMRQTFVIKEGENIPLGFKDSEEKDKDAKLAKVTEIWDKRGKKHFGLVEGMDRILKFKAGTGEADDDPLKLSGFWPYPKPMFTNVVAGKVIPIPDYLYYQDQALELDSLTGRINALTQELKWRGVQDASFKELANLAKADDKTFVAVENFNTRFGEGKGLEAVFAEMPLAGILSVLKFLHDAREQVKQTIYEITGISDIVRGATKASETLGAQQLKGQFANMRLSVRQRKVQRFARDIFRIKAEIIAEHFQPEVLSMMTGIEVTDDIMQILRSDVLRNFSIDIETDSTILADQSEDQKNKTEAVKAITELLLAWAPLIQGMPQLMPLLTKLALFQLSAFKDAGRVLEDAFEALGDSAVPGPAQVGGGPGGTDPAAGNNISAIQ